jgi:aminoglycoside phosphotransferase family enzyme
LTIGGSVYKWKKPVKFDFIDLSTMEARRPDCEREVEVNRRLAPDVYKGAAELRGVDGLPCEHLVVMKRMPTDKSLTRLVNENDVSGASAVDDVAVA